MRIIGVVFAVGAVAGSLAAQSSEALERRVAAVHDGTVRLAFAPRRGVCGAGANGWYTTAGGRRARDVEIECVSGPVHVAIDRAGGRTIAVRTYVGGRWTVDGRAVDLGVVGTAAAADFLLDLAEREAPAERDAVADAALQGATLADSVVIWPRLLAMAKHRDRSLAVRKRAIFWLAQAAGDRVSDDLAALATSDPDDDVRNQAVFALSQRPANEGVPALMAVARDRRLSTKVRRQAYFWLGQTQDARAVAFLEETLTKP